MKTCMFMMIAALACIYPVICTAEVIPEDMTRAIDTGNLRHPYLFFTAEEKAGILERIDRDPESRDIMARLLAEGNRLLFTQVESPLPP